MRNEKIVLVGGVYKSEIPEGIGHAGGAQRGKSCIFHSLDGTLGVRINLRSVCDCDGDRRALVGEKFAKRAFRQLACAVIFVTASFAVDFELQPLNFAKKGEIRGGFGRGGESNDQIRAFVD